MDEKKKQTKRKKETIFVFKGALREVKLLNEENSVLRFKIPPPPLY